MNITGRIQTVHPHILMKMYDDVLCSVFSGGRSSHTSFCSLTCALASISVLTISTCPPCDAVISGVSPLCIEPLP